VWNGLKGHLKTKEFELEAVAGQRQLSVGDAVLRQAVRASVIRKKLLMSRLNWLLFYWKRTRDLEYPYDSR
jgi:hypothetical protein